jgi:membrane protease YdiL (CAAX protease family)
VVKTSTSARSPLSPTLWPADAFRWYFSLAVALVLVLASVIPAAVFIALLVAFRLATPHDLRTLSWPLLAGQLASYAVGLALLAVVMPPLAQRSFRALGLRAPRASDLVWGIGGAVAMLLAATLTGAVQEALFHLKADEVQVHWLREARGTLIAGFVFLACVAAPFMEELTFRAFFFNAMLRYTPAAVAVLLSSILFGFAHWQPGNAGAIAPLAASGIVLATVYYRSGSLTASMLTHALFNFITVVFVLVLHQPV